MARRHYIIEPEPLIVRVRTRVTLLVPVVLLLAAWFVGPSSLPVGWRLAGTLCVLLGAGLRLWASGYLRKLVELVSWGPFAYMRNPLYVGTLLIGCGYAMLTGRWESLGVVALVMLACYVPTIRYEEAELRALFGEPYVAYCRDVPRWVPRAVVRRCPPPEGGGYCWALVRFNREHIHVLLHLALLCLFYLVYLLKA